MSTSEALHEASSALQRGDPARASTIARAAARRCRDPALRSPLLRLLGDSLRLLGSYAEAERALRRALDAARRLGPRHLEAAITLNQLGVLLKARGRPAEAARLYRRALVIVAGQVPSGHSIVATLEHNLGGAEHARGRYRAGERHARTAVALRARTLGDDHPDVAADLAALGGLLDGQKRWAESEPIYQRALAILEPLPDRALDVAAALNNLAAVRAARGDFASAERHLRRSIAHKARALGRSHPDLASSWHNLSVILDDAGQRVAARRAARRAISLLQPLGPRHPVAVAARENLAALLPPR